ncbi:MAG TPA: NrsF family protein [Bryobacteraceae bacterium]|nr:NrsF family protein [Bryobacteraceae bacterium]
MPSRLRQATPDPARVARIREKFSASAAPVRPLPSNGRLTAAILAVFVVVAIALAAPFGYRGFAKMSPAAAWVDYSAIVLLAAVLAGMVIGAMIPGSRRVLSPLAGAAAAVVLLCSATLLLFPSYDMTRFFARGIPCLRLGTLCAVPGGIAAWLLMRRGFIVDPARAAFAGGALAGLLGIAVLALHCPIFTAPHIIVWHVGVIVVTSIAGAVAGWIFFGRRASIDA